MDQGTVFYICTHGRFGEEIVKSAEMIYDRLDDVKVFSLLPGMSPEEYNACIEKELIKEEREILAIVDLFGGTPCNTMAILSRNYHLKIVSGLNLAMLIELYSQKDVRSLEELVEIGIRTVQESAKDVLKVLRREN